MRSIGEKLNKDYVCWKLMENTSIGLFYRLESRKLKDYYDENLWYGVGKIVREIRKYDEKNSGL